MQLFISLAIPSLAFISNLTLAVVILSRGPLRRLNQIFALNLFTLAIWGLSALMMRIWPTFAGADLWNKIEGSAVIVYFAIYLHFVILYLRLHNSWYMALLAYLLALGFVYAYWSGLILRFSGVGAGGLVEYEIGPVTPIFMVVALFFMGLGTYYLIREYRKSYDWAFRNRILYLLGSLALIVFGGLTNALPVLGRYPIDLGADSISALLITYAIVRHQLLEVRLVVRKGLVYSILTVAVTAAYLLFLFLLQTVFHATIGYTTLIAASLGALMLAALFQPLRDLIQQGIDRAFYRGTYDYRQTLREFSQAMTTILDLDHLTERIVDMVSKTMGTPVASIFLLDEKDHGYELNAHKGLGQLADGYKKFRADNPVVRYLAKERNFLATEEVNHLPRFRGLWEEEKRQILALGAELFLALNTKGRLIGVMVLGQKGSGGSYTGEDIELLSTVVNQAAIAVENARLYQELHRDLRQRVDELQQTQAQLIQAAKLAGLGQLAAGIAHEINNPLTGILMATSLILEEMDNGAPRRKELEIIEREAQRARGIVRGLLDFARQTEGKVADVDVNDIVQGALGVVRRQAEIKGIAIEEGYAAEWTTVRVDKNQLQQAFFNIIHNAIDAMPEGGRLVIKTSVANGLVKVEFSDTGAGIAKENLLKIFDPFFTSKRGRGGTGLGLSITHGIVTKYGGTIEVESEVERGSTFAILLPAVALGRDGS